MFFSCILILFICKSQEYILILVLSSQYPFTLIPMFTLSMILRSFPHFWVCPSITVLLPEVDLPLTWAGWGQSSDGARHAKCLSI